MSSISIDRTLSGATTPGQNEPGSDGNERVVHIPPEFQYYQNLTIRLFNVISRALIREGLIHSAEMQSVYSTTQLTGL